MLDEFGIRRALLVLSGATWLVGWALAAGHPAAPETFFPRTGQAAGWTKMPGIRAFEAAQLWRYVDGDAERYLRSGVVKTLTADYRYAGKFDATVDLHILSTASGARKIFENEASTGSHPVAIGDAGRHYGSSITFCKGRYFVRLVAYQQAPELARALGELAKAIAANLPAR